MNKKYDELKVGDLINFLGCANPVEIVELAGQKITGKQRDGGKTIRWCVYVEMYDAGGASPAPSGKGE